MTNLKHQKYSATHSSFWRLKIIDKFSEHNYFFYNWNKILNCHYLIFFIQKNSTNHLLFFGIFWVKTHREYRSHGTEDVALLHSGQFSNTPPSLDISSRWGRVKCGPWHIQQHMDAGRIAEPSSMKLMLMNTSTVIGLLITSNQLPAHRSVTMMYPLAETKKWIIQWNQQISVCHHLCKPCLGLKAIAALLYLHRWYHNPPVKLNHAVCPMWVIWPGQRPNVPAQKTEKKNDIFRIWQKQKCK